MNKIFLSFYKQFSSVLCAFSFLLATPTFGATEIVGSRIDILCKFERGERGVHFYPFVRISFEANDPKYLVLSDEEGDFSIFASGYLSGAFGQGPNEEARALTGKALISNGSDGYLRVIVIVNDRPGFVLDITPSEARILDFGAFPGMGEGSCNGQI